MAFALNLMLVLLFVAPGWAAKWKPLSKGDLTTKVGSIQPELQMTVKPESGTAPQQEYHPAPSRWNFLSLGYANFGATISSKTPNSSIEDTKYGSSNANDFQFRFFGKRVSYELFYQSYKGYYLKNTADVVPNYDMNSPLLQQPNMVMEAEGINVIYNFNSEDYNLGAAFNQSARQVESGGAWLAIASLNRQRLANTDPFVMGTAVGQYPGFEDIRALQIYTVSLGGGGGYTAVWRNYYAAIKLLISAGAQKVSTDSVSATTEDMNQNNARLHGKLGLGYNGDTFLAGVRYTVDNNNLRVQKTSMSINTGEVQIHLGWRFHELGWTWVDQLSEWLFPN